MKQGTNLTLGTCKIVVGEPLAKGDLCDLYHCTFSEPPGKEPPKGKTRWELLMESEGGDNTQGVIKVVRQVGDNDMVAAEASALNRLYPPGTSDEKFFRYLPQLRIATQHEGRQINVFAFMEGYVSLAEILKEYPDGIDFRDLAWMFKRLLVALGFAHGRGYVHGAVLPPHVMVHPVGHGAKLIDWSYATRMDRKVSIKAYSAPWRAYYAPEVFAKQLPTPAVDIYMAAKCAVALLGGSVETNEVPEDVPNEICRLLAECLVESPSQRPQDAWKLHSRFDKILRDVVGEPKYRPFDMPAPV